MCILREVFFAAMLAILAAAQGQSVDQGSGIDPNGAVTVDAGSCIDPNGCAGTNASVRIDDNG